MAESAEQSELWERETIKKILFEYGKEQRRRRRWSVFFKFLFFLWLFLTLLLLFSPNKYKSDVITKEHVGLVDIQGMIVNTGETNADSVVRSLKRAFDDDNTVGIILRINSPGGTPVQADYIYSAIKDLRAQHPNTKVYAVCTDICASGGYYIAAAADEIYANPASLIGSIGVVYNGFGFVDTLDKLGVQRRIVTAGQHKGFLDPFSPLNDQDLNVLKSMLDSTHQLFISRVRAGRGKRLSDSPDIFSGFVWTGLQAKDLGLIDGFGSPREVATTVIKNDYVIDYTEKPNIFDKLSKGFNGPAARFSDVIGGLTANKLALM